MTVAEPQLPTELLPDSRVAARSARRQRRLDARVARALGRASRRGLPFRLLPWPFRRRLVRRRLLREESRLSELLSSTLFDRRARAGLESRLRAVHSALEVVSPGLLAAREATRAAELAAAEDAASSAELSRRAAEEDLAWAERELRMLADDPGASPEAVAAVAARVDAAVASLRPVPPDPGSVLPGPDSDEFRRLQEEAELLRARAAQERALQEASRAEAERLREVAAALAASREDVPTVEFVAPSPQERAARRRSPLQVLLRRQRPALDGSDEVVVDDGSLDDDEDPAAEPPYADEGSGAAVTPDAGDATASDDPAPADADLADPDLSDAAPGDAPGGAGAGSSRAGVLGRLFAERRAARDDRRYERDLERVVAELDAGGAPPPLPVDLSVSPAPAAAADAEARASAVDEVDRTSSPPSAVSADGADAAGEVSARRLSRRARIAAAAAAAPQPLSPQERRRLRRLMLERRAFELMSASGPASRDGDVAPSSSGAGSEARAGDPAPDVDRTEEERSAPPTPVPVTSLLLPPPQSGELEDGDLVLVPEMPSAAPRDVARLLDEDLPEGVRRDVVEWLESLPGYVVDRLTASDVRRVARALEEMRRREVADARREELMAEMRDLAAVLQVDGADLFGFLEVAASATPPPLEDEEEPEEEPEPARDLSARARRRLESARRREERRLARAHARAERAAARAARKVSEIQEDLDRDSPPEPAHLDPVAPATVVPSSSAPAAGPTSAAGEPDEPASDPTPDRGPSRAERAELRRARREEARLVREEERARRRAEAALESRPPAAVPEEVPAPSEGSGADVDVEAASAPSRREESRRLRQERREESRLLRQERREARRMRGSGEADGPSRAEERERIRRERRASRDRIRQARADEAEGVRAERRRVRELRRQAKADAAAQRRARKASPPPAVDADSVRRAEQEAEAYTWDVESQVSGEGAMVVDPAAYDLPEPLPPRIL